ncbi:MAG: heparinase II/III family protein [Rhodovarius sp.]|nr:heparinase II/III family protein [Rhodovarius sp.]MCX7931601.1 heparinase II/III family protein [Rhodovarius sp.]MDW8314392.1 heparinase II/III family protein [Rhodovarius sp.]
MADLWRSARRWLTQLRPLRVPEAPARAFKDLWPGDAARGQRLVGGVLEAGGAAYPLLPATAEAPSQGWGPADGPLLWRAAAHGFCWLRDLRALGTDEAVVTARDLAHDWLAHGAAEELAQAPEVAGARISALLGHWDFLAATADDAFRRALMARIVQDGRAILSALPAEAAHRGALVTLKAAIAAAVALEEPGWLQRALRLLPGELERQFYPDGGHVERSPSQHLAALQDLIEIRNLIHGVGAQPPASLPLVIERACQALRFWRHPDGSLALFNGSREESGTLVDLVLHHGQARGRAPMLLQDTGFHRLQASRTLVLVDCGAPPPGAPPDPATGLPRGADRFAHAGTLSFEMSVGRDRVVVNCGAVPFTDGAWRDALRSTAAHSTLVLADTSSAELRPEGLGRRPEHVEVSRIEQDHAHFLELTHDGYRRQFHALHRRKLYLAENGDDLRGEDAVELPGGEVESLAWVVRFHLHPHVLAMVQEGEQGVLIRLPSGQGWRLRARGARVSLEESVYWGGGEMRRSQQVVLAAEPGVASVVWAISRVPAQGE